MLTLLSALLLFPSPAGSYAHSVGRVGSGGAEQRLTLSADGTFLYSSRGCFVDDRRAGTYRQSGDRIALIESSTGSNHEPWQGRLFRIVRGPHGTLRLVDDDGRSYDSATSEDEAERAAANAPQIANR